MVGRSSRTIYIGNLPLDVTDWEIEDLFYKYGCILDIESKLPPPPPGYRFIEFEDAWAAEDAIRGRDGYNFDGCCLRVELSHGGRGSSSSFDRRVDTVVEVEAALVSLVALSIEVHFFLGLLTSHFILSNLVVVVRGLPASASWQDLKDHMRKGGEDVCFAEVFRDGDGAMGIVDYTNYEDMKYTIRKLDDSEFRNPFRRSYIRLKLYDGSPYGRRRRSRSLSRSRSRTPRRNRTKPVERSRSISKSRSPSRSRSASPSRFPRKCLG